MDIRSTIISQHTKLNGTLTTTNNITIFGTYEGEIQSDADVKVTKEGSLNSKVSCNNLTIEGFAESETTCRQTLTITPEGEYKGKATIHDLCAENGSSITAEIKMKR